MYGGKIALITKEVMAAMEIAKLDDNAKQELPKNLRKWAEENKMPVTMLESNFVEWAKAKGLETDKMEKKTSKSSDGAPLVTVKIPLFLLDSRIIRNAFHSWYDESQIDVMLERYWQLGFMAGKSDKGFMHLVIGIVAIVMVVVVLILVLVGTGVLKF